jgi:hypothetical protein
MKLFKYNQFINESNQDIHFICKEYGIKNYSINDDGSVDVDGDVDLSDKGLTKLPLKFRKVSGDFNCDNNQLTSLEGCPQKVGRDFYCSNNKLTSLEGSPQSVGGSFYCDDNKLTSLEGSPQSVGGNFSCDNNKLKDVYGLKEGFKIGGDIYLYDNPVYEIFKLFPEYRYSEVIEYLNEYEVVRDGNKVILQALEMVFEEMVLEVPEIEYIEGYEII